ncbi:hypothetical protein M8J76_011743 [Diaphorina citri]|nr:hypothetical protein M8J76_011743 [Diaphorina citri]
MMSLTPDHEGIRNGPEKSPRSTVRSFGHPCSYMDDIIPDSRILSDMQFEYSTLENCALRWNINSYLTRGSVLCSHKPCAASGALPVLDRIIKDINPIDIINRLDVERIKKEQKILRRI